MKGLFCFFFVAFAVGAYGLTDEQRQIFQRNYQQCVQGTGVNEELIQKMRTGTFNEDAKLKTYIRCMFVKMSIMNEPGEVQLDVVEALSASNPKREVALKVAKSCVGEQGKTLDDKAFNIYKCFRAGAENPIPF